MTTPNELGMITPDGQDWLRDGDNAITTNAQVVADIYDVQAALNYEFGQGLKVRRDYTALPANVNDWIGLEWGAIWIVPVPPTMFAGLPAGIGLCYIVIIPMGTSGSAIRVYEYAGEQRVFSRTVSTSPDRVTNWKLNETKTRRVLHQLTMPGAPTLTDSEPTRHVRLPIKLGARPAGLDITFKNFNERSGTNFGDLDFEDVYIAPMAVGAFGQATPNFAVPPTNLGKPIPTGDGTSRRYQLIRPDWIPEKNTEYILSYAYTDPTPSANQLSISGSFNGTNPAGVGAMTVTNTWSQYTPLEVYLSMDVSIDVPTEVFFDSSSGTGLNSNWPLRDSWAWGVAESNGSLPVMLCMSGQTTKAFAAGGFVWSKLQVFAPVDKAHIASGSNDSQSYPLEEMKTDFVALANRIRDRNVSQNIVAHNFFPRAAESSTVKQRRLGYDAWLFGELPGGILAAYDRAKYLIGADGLMRIELNSGDGVHVNNWGQRLMRAAVITGKTLEKSVTFQDITTQWDGGLGGGRVELSRGGNLVQLVVYGNKAPAVPAQTQYVLPPGYRPMSGMLFDDGIYGAVGSAQRVIIHSNGAVQFFGLGAGDTYFTVLTWLTNEPMPVS